ncbi:MAG TPA: HNH endonuclease signature motif containing protein [Patescibacteria group bacterium]|nr:HNH endonuclease signature motif containing protein [Patescibacteria group bacterium]
MSMPAFWPTLRRPASQWSKGARAFPRKRPSGWRETPAGWRCVTIPTALRRALAYRDHGCRFPGCDLPFGQPHHIKHWAQGGPTTLWNLVLLCRRHHRSVHEEGFRVERRENGELLFRSPDGHVLPQVPPTPKTPADAAAEVRARNTAAGVRVHPHTATPAWDGRPLNVRWAIDVLHPLANPR